MNLPAELSTTRRALHAVAELLIAGPQYEAVGDIRLAARPGGFGGWVGPTPNAVSGTDLITATGRFPLGGSVNDLARRAGITPRALRDVYTGGPDFSLDEPTEVTASSAEVLLRGSPMATPRCGCWIRDRSRSCGRNISTSASPWRKSTTGCRPATQ